MNKKVVFTIAGIGVLGAVISIIQYKIACAETDVLEKELEELKDYNSKLDEIKQQIEAQKNTEEDFLYTERTKLDRINNTVFRLVED